MQLQLKSTTGKTILIKFYINIYINFYKKTFFFRNLNYDKAMSNLQAEQSFQHCQESIWWNHPVMTKTHFIYQ